MRSRVVALLFFALSACQPGLDRQPKVKRYSALAIRETPIGTLAVEDQPTTRPALSLSVLKRGREVYNIQCSVCHGLTGDGSGMAVQRGFPVPASFHQSAQRKLSLDRLYQIASEGAGAMYGFKSRLKDSDRWAVIYYLRALQISQHFPVSRPRDGTKQ